VLPLELRGHRYETKLTALEEFSSRVRASRREQNASAAVMPRKFDCTR